MTKTSCGEDLCIYSDREEIKYIDSTPDEEYPERILQAYLTAAEGTVMVGHGDTAEMVAEVMNEAQAERAKILRQALQDLYRGRALRLNEDYNPEA